MEENTQLQLRQLSANKCDVIKSGSQELDTSMAASGGNHLTLFLSVLLFSTLFYLPGTKLTWFLGSSLLDQLSSSAQSEVVRLNLENSRLRAELEGLRENLSLEKASLETALDNEKKKSALKVRK